jgi:hypothetical protein
MATYLDEMFQAKAVKEGGIVRRYKGNVDRFVPFHRLLSRVQREKFHLVEVGDQYIIICNPGQIKLHC